MDHTSNFAELNRTSIARATKLAAIALENAEKIAKLNVAAAEAAFAQGVDRASAMAAVKDGSELVALPAKYAESGVQNFIGYSRGLYEISSATQTQYSLVAKEAFDGYTKGFAAWVEKDSASAPAGSELAFNAFKSSVAATSAAFDQFEKASKQVASFADASMRAAVENAAKVTAPPKGRKAA
jgi:phasin family protein